MGYRKEVGRVKKSFEYIEPTLLNNDEDKYIIDKFPEELFQKYSKIVISDDAGMGKSTLMKRIFLSMIEQNKGVPILIELRKLNSNNSIVKEIQSQISGIEEPFEDVLILDLLKKGGFTMLLDGFDEIPIENKDDIIYDIKTIVENCSNCKFIITSRPENSLSTFGSFEKFYIEPLSIQKSYSIIRRYDKFNHKPISEELIKALEEENGLVAREFIYNPFLVSLLFKAYHYKRKIPFYKPQFFRQVFEALYENHDLSKEGYYVRPKKSNLHIDDFEKVLRYFGFITSKVGQLEYSKEALLKFLTKAQQASQLQFKVSDFITDLLSSVPLIKEEGVMFKWSHKAMQDYFAAKFLHIDANQKQHQTLLKLFNYLRVNTIADLLTFSIYSLSLTI